MSIETLTAQLLVQLECPVCYDTCKPPIYMCTNGHIVCAECQLQLNECSTCRAAGKPTIRCLHLEKMSVLVKNPCENQPHGCTLTFSSNNMAMHLRNCDHGFKCHVCKTFKGTKTALKKHVVKKHPSYFFQCSSTGLITQKSNIPTNKKFHDKSYFYMYFFNNDIFWLEDKYNSSMRVFSRTLRIVSKNVKEAARYYYSMEFKSKDKQSLDMVYYKVNVLAEGVNSGDMNIVIPGSIVDSYQDGKIEYTLHISLNWGASSQPALSRGKVVEAYSSCTPVLADQIDRAILKMEQAMNDMGAFFIRLSVPKGVLMSSDTINEQLLHQLECPICLKTCLPPIFMCKNGHSVCAKCQAQLSECSECHSPGQPTLRCVQLEGIAALVKIPCANYPHGCAFTFNLIDMEKHFPRCGHSFECFICADYKGSSKSLNDHVLSQHVSYHLGCLSDDFGKKLSTVIPTAKIYHDNSYFYMLTFDDDVFWLVKKYSSSTNIFSMALRIVSYEESDAARYYYSVKFRPKDKDNELKIFYQASVQTVASANDSMDFVLPRGITDSLDDGKIWFTIKMAKKTLYQ